MKRLAAVTILGVFLLAGCGGSKDRPAPPDLSPGVKVEISYANAFEETLVVDEVRGNWVRMKADGKERQYWVNFDEVRWYRLKD